MKGKKDVWMEEEKAGWKERRIDGCMEGWIEGKRMDGRLGRMKGWME